MKKTEPTTPAHVREQCLAILESFAESVNRALPTNLRTSRSEIARALGTARDAMTYVDTGVDLSVQRDEAETHGVLVRESVLDSVLSFARNEWGDVTIFPYHYGSFQSRYVVHVKGEREALQALVDTLESLSDRK